MINVLFLCSGNAARSLLGEALVNSLGANEFKGHSAGSTPRAAPHPMALEVLQANDHNVFSLRPKSWDEFGSDDAKRMHIVIHVCREAERDCPYWPDHPVSVSWTLPDPTHIEGPGQRMAFEATYVALRARISRLVKLDLVAMDVDEARRRIQHIHDDLS